MLSRRDVLQSAVVIGGTSALSACVQISETTDDPRNSDFPPGPDELDELPDRQHAWGKYIVRNARQNPVFPQHQVASFLEYTGSVPPTEEERQQVEEALRTLERAYQWGTGGNASAQINNGLLLTIAYGPSYFDQFDHSLPDSVDLPSAADTLRELDSDVGLADDSDAVLHYGSDHPEIVLAVEEALFGTLDRINGVDVEGRLSDVFEVKERRAGVIGRGIAKKKLNNDNIPNRSPLSMGFKSVFKDALPSENKVTIPDGPFAGGTTQHFSRMEIDLDEWYDEDHEARVHKMFGPSYSEEDVGTIGDALGGESRITREQADNVEQDAREKGVVGHTQKTARARDEDFDPRIIRRGEILMPAESGAVLNFGSLQRGIGDFIETRKAMQEVHYGSDTDSREDDVDLDEAHHGILHYFNVTNRANFLMPKRVDRALPTPEPE